jgi:uncharacterized FAD-dependent dehydrogenase
LLIISKELKGVYISKKRLVIPYKIRDKKVIVVESGPASFFVSYTLQLAGFQVKIIERGLEVNKRAKDIYSFEKEGKFHAKSNYAFGEGGAGTFSDGKLTSRSKHILSER